jgi:hypothetical protein
MDLRRHLDWLAGQLEARTAALATLRSLPGLRMTVHCVWVSRYGDGGPTLWPPQMLAIAAHDLQCTFEVSFPNGPTL